MSFATTARAADVTSKHSTEVKPLSVAQWEYAQPKHDHLPHVNFRLQCVGRTQAGKGTLLLNTVTRWYHGVWSKIICFAGTVGTDDTWKSLEDYCIRSLGQDPEREPFMFSTLDERRIAKIIEDQRLRNLKQKNEVKEGERDKLQGILLVIDDFSGDPSLRRSSGVLNRLFTVARHVGISIWTNVHDIVSLGPLARRQTSCFVVFRLSDMNQYKSLKEAYARMLPDPNLFDEIYEAATSEKYGFLVIYPNATDPNRMFMASWKHWLEVV